MKTLKSWPALLQHALSPRDEAPSITAVVPLPPLDGTGDPRQLTIESALKEASALLSSTGATPREQREILDNARSELSRCATDGEAKTIAVLADASGAHAVGTADELERAVVVDSAFSPSTILPRAHRAPLWYLLAVSDADARLWQVQHGQTREVPWSLEREDRADANRERVQPIEGGSAHAHASGAGGDGSTMNTHGFGHERVDDLERDAWYRVIARGLADALPDPRAPFALVADTVHIGALTRRLHIDPSVRVQHDPSSLDAAAIAALAEDAIDAEHAKGQDQHAEAWFAAAHTQTELSALVEDAKNARIENIYLDPAAIDDDHRSAIDAAIRETIHHGGQLVLAGQDKDLQLEDGAGAILRW